MSEQDSVAYAWGRIFGIIDGVSKLTPSEVSRAAIDPLAVFGSALSKRMRKIPEATNQKITEWAEEIPPDFSGQLSSAQQGQFFVGFYKAKSKEKNDWSKADWTKTDAELKREYNVTRQTVHEMRKKYGPK